ncbi:OmpA family protein [Aquincola sp. MAHUQ-54]|uniref:OmpA family protein n=1 Tax=Aquincola agrisoli TaxID=3119538 RepID=A0AAW9QBB0_9BURK
MIPSSSFRRRTGAAGAALAALMIAGCASGPPQASRAPGSEADRRAAAPAALMAEQQWLQQWFSGTPVQIVMARDGTLRVDVPAAFAFDAGQAGVKPPLAAVLDRVAESLRRNELLVVSVSVPAASDAALAKRRHDAVARHLAGRGVAAARVGTSPANGAVLGLRLAVGDA